MKVPNGIPSGQANVHSSTPGQTGSYHKTHKSIRFLTWQWREGVASVRLENLVLHQLRYGKKEFHTGPSP